MKPQTFVENYRGGTIFKVGARIDVYRWEERGIRQRTAHNRDLGRLKKFVDKIRDGDKKA